MATSTTTSSGGIGIVGLLTVAFVILKLIGQISWSWWWVLSPIWISFLFVIAIFLCIAIGAFIYQGFKNRKMSKILMKGDKL